MLNSSCLNCQMRTQICHCSCASYGTELQQTKERRAKSNLANATAAAIKDLAFKNKAREAMI